MIRKSYPEHAPATTGRYIAGFILSLGLTIMAYLTVRQHLANHHSFPTDNIVLIILAGLAVAQLMAQLVFFLHLNRQSKPRWNLLVFWFMLIIVFTIAAGSLWIMHNLNYRMTPEQINQYM